MSLTAWRLESGLLASWAVPQCQPYRQFTCERYARNSDLHVPKAAHVRGLKKDPIGLADAHYACARSQINKGAQMGSKPVARHMLCCIPNPCGLIALHGSHFMFHGGFGEFYEFHQ